MNQISVDTKLAIALLILVTITAIALYMLSQRRKRKATELALKLQEMELMAWSSKMNPHFLFNSLSAISSIVKANENEKAIEYINSFSIVLRKTIQNSRKLLTKISSEVKYIEQYLLMEKIKREGNLEYEISCEPAALLEYYIPTLIVQPAVENSLKHGIKEQKDGKIFIKIIQVNNLLQCTVSDNGSCMKNYDNAPKDPEYKSMGIALVHEKLRIIKKVYNFSITFQYQHADPETKRGVTSIYTWPIINKNPFDESTIN